MSSRVMPTRGMRDFLPTDKARREHVLGILRDTYTSLGFQELETPAMEPITRLKSGQGGENETMLFEVLRRGLDPEKKITPAEAVDLGMRYDLTLPLSRYYATHMQELPQVFRAFQTGPVWRAERPQKGRFRQFNQVDIDILGSASYVAEVEVLSTGWIAAKRLGLAQDCTILLNHRQLLNELMRSSGIAEEHFGQTLIELDKLAKIGPENVQSGIVDGGLGTAEQAKRLLEAVEELASTELADSAQEVKVESFGATLDLYDLPKIVAAVKELHPDVSIRFDPTLVRGMGYYTGPIFEIAHNKFGSSICGGGRYDGVVGRWSNQEVPAVGLSFGFERIIDLVKLGEDESGAQLALAYQKDHEALAALRVRGALDALASSGQLQLQRVGLFKAPRKMNARFYDELASNGYTKVLLPSAFLDINAEDEQVLIELVAGAKMLG